FKSNSLWSSSSSVRTNTRWSTLALKVAAGTRRGSSTLSCRTGAFSSSPLTRSSERGGALDGGGGGGGGAGKSCADGASLSSSTQKTASSVVRRKVGTSAIRRPARNPGLMWHTPCWARARYEWFGLMSVAYCSSSPLRVRL